MDPIQRNLIAALHHAPYRWVLALTGGGSGAGAQLFSVPGGSRTLLELLVPYHEQALLAFLGNRPEQFCSPRTSQVMARRARERACWLAAGQAVLGLGCTASLATDRPKHGDDRFHVTVDSGDHHTTYSLILQKGARDREGEEAILDAVLLNALAEAVGVPQRLQPHLLPSETVQVESELSAEPLAALLRGELSVVCREMDARQHVPADTPAVVLPGSFNPLHEGHEQLAAIASRLSARPTAFELSVTNADKPALAREEVERRLSQFTWRAPIWVTRAPTFAEKALLFPGAVFVVGADTAVRIVSPRYYQESVMSMTEALERLRQQGCRFLVAGREDATGKFIGCGDLVLPEAFRDLFVGIPQEGFHMPISSTQVRERVCTSSLAPKSAEE
jgi:hypothetical protein